MFCYFIFGFRQSCKQEWVGMLTGLTSTSITSLCSWWDSFRQTTWLTKQLSPVSPLGILIQKGIKLNKLRLLCYLLNWKVFWFFPFRTWLLWFSIMLFTVFWDEILLISINKIHPHLWILTIFQYLEYLFDGYIYIS